MNVFRVIELTFLSIVYVRIREVVWDCFNLFQQPVPVGLDEVTRGSMCAAATSYRDTNYNSLRQVMVSLSLFTSRYI